MLSKLTAFPSRTKMGHVHSLSAIVSLVVTVELILDAAVLSSRPLRTRRGVNTLQSQDSENG